MKKLLTAVLFIGLLGLNFNFAQALTYQEILQNQKGKVLGVSTGTITASPNPVQVCDGSTTAGVTISATAQVNYDVRINSSTGDLFAQQAANTQTVKQTGNWVTDGMKFFVVDTATKEVLGYATVSFTSQGCPNSISASPNPIKVCSGNVATTTIIASAAVNYDIRVNSPTGDLFAQQAANTTTTKDTGNWVTNGMKFYLLNSATQTILASVTVNFTTQGCPASLTLSPNPIKTCFGNTATTTVTGWAPVDYEVHTSSPTGDLFTKQAANTSFQQATGNWVTNGMTFYIIDSSSKATLATVSAQVNSDGCSFSNQVSQFNNIKSVTWYEFGPSYSQSLSNLKQALPKIKQAGFNAVWLVTPWQDLNPKPLASPPVFNEANFAALKDALSFLRVNGVQALIGLNYLGNGWSPEGIDYCNWINDQAQYKAFINYSAEFLTRLDGYGDVANILVFTENAEPCGVNAYTNAKQTAASLRNTLGNLPAQLPAPIRSKFKIGYHDYNLLNLGWAGGDSPIASPNSFDFVSMVAYDLESKTNEEIKTEINLRASRFKALYPNTPLIVGEFGARSCSADQDINQARVDSAIIQTAIGNNYGFNLWGYKPVASDECTKQLSGYGYAITNYDGSNKPAVNAIMVLLGTTSTALNIPTPTPIPTPSPTPTPATATAKNYSYPSSSLVNDSGTIYFICGKNKIPFTNWQAFVGLGYSLRNVIKGDLSSYALPQTYLITTANAEHPWCSWLYHNGTVYYSHESGLIPVPSWDVFLNNGGQGKFIVKANKYDIDILNSGSNLPVLNNNDTRVYR